jgi:hypothetical protein
MSEEGDHCAVNFPFRFQGFYALISQEYDGI